MDKKLHSGLYSIRLNGNACLAYIAELVLLVSDERTLQNETIQ